MEGMTRLEGYHGQAKRRLGWQPAWERLVAAKESGAIVSGVVTMMHQDRVYVDLGEGVRGVMPLSQFDLHRVWTDVTGFVGREVVVRIVEVDPAAEVVVVSRKAAQAELARDTLRHLREGAVLEAVVRAITPRGDAVVDLGGVSALLPRREIVTFGDDPLRVGDLLDVKVLALSLPTAEADRADAAPAADGPNPAPRIIVSIRALHTQDWVAIAERWAPQTVGLGRLRAVQDRFTIVELDPGVDAVAYGPLPWPATVGDQVRVRVLRVQPEHQRIVVRCLSRVAGR